MPSQTFQMQIDEDGADALCHLGRGDMRQTLNILQSIVMAHGEVTMENAYLCTGNPPPSTIETIVHCLLNKDVSSSFSELHSMQARNFRKLPSVTLLVIRSEMFIFRNSF
jgi:DNA polymerase III delta prime subunit